MIFYINIGNNMRHIPSGNILSEGYANSALEARLAVKSTDRTVNNGFCKVGHGHVVAAVCCKNIEKLHKY